jgi:type 1 glutamine amidotransferase
MHRLLSTLVLTALIGGLGAPAAHARYRVLVFTKTTGFRHDSIPAGVRAITELGRRHGFAVDATGSAARFRGDRLARYDALVFLSTTGDLLPRASQRAALRHYIEHGGGFLGVHAAADAGASWPWYRRLIGARFRGHPAGTPRAVVRVEDRDTAATRGLPAAWTRVDEWYDFDANPRGHVHVLATVDESTYAGGSMGADHPIAWCRRFDGGRSVYTAMGHTIASYSEPRFDRHLLGAIEMAAGHARFDCSTGSSGATVRARRAPHQTPAP